MQEVESTGRTIDEAILMAVAQLGVRREDLDIEILEEPVKGMLGLIGGKPARISARVKGSVQVEISASESPAGAFLMGVCERMHVPAKVTVSEMEGTVYAEFSGPEMGFLIGHRGETLDALQYLTSLVVNRETEDYTRVVLDTENYRKRREETLIRLAKRIADKVARSGKKFRLEPMNPYERRIIHFALQGDERVMTASEGEEPYRRVVISVK
jgi:spoIIIJ-associated protein